MLFQIDESVVNTLSSATATDAERNGLFHLTLGARDGHHRITGDRSVLRRLIELKTISERERSVLARAAGRLAEEGKLHEKLRAYGRVVSTTQSHPSSQRVGGQRVITMPLQWFDSTAKVQPITLIGENLTDVSIFNTMGYAGTLLAGLKYLPIKTLPSNGGGITTVTVLAQQCAEERLCLCIVDSDKAAPMSNSGSTAQSVASYKDVASYPLVEVIETASRELENILPSRFYVATYGSQLPYQRLARLMSSLGEASESDARLHIDVKKGLRLSDIWAAQPNSPERAFWEQKRVVLMTQIGLDESSFPCLQNACCPHAVRGDCTCILLDGNRSNMLSEFVTFCSGIDRYQLVGMLDEPSRAEWVRLGSVIASWACGDSKLRV